MPEKKVAKVVYHTDSTDTTGTVWMDVTQKTVTTNNMLSGITSLKNDGTDITGNIASKTSSDLIVSGATITAPAGYYSSNASESVASGTAGTPTATKGTVSNHSISVTPSVTNTTGYITGSTKTGTAVSVSASELVSGTKSITENGTGIDVTNYASVDVEVPPYVATLTSSGLAVYAYVTYNNTEYYTSGNTFNFTPGDTLVLHAYGTSKFFKVNDVVVSESSSQDTTSATYNYTLPYDNISIALSFSSNTGSVQINVITSHPIVSSLTVTAAGTYGDSHNAYSPVTVAAGTATAPSTISGSSATVTAGTNTITLSKTVSVTPTISTAGYISSGTAGNSDVSLTASVNTHTSSDLTASGATVTAPAGYYASDATKSVASGTEGTPTATKGTVSNHSVSVTPSVTNSAGYISGGTKTGTAVTVSASELVSGNKEITTNGTEIDVANYSTVSVAVSGNGGSAISVVDTLDANGGTIRTITAVDISSDTVTAAHLESGYTAHDAAGNAITGTYSAPSATQHVIHFDFSDNSDTDINVYYNDSLIGTMITAYTPTTYNNKTVTYASLDNTAWYEPTAIPLNTQLIDYTKCTYNKALNSSGEEIAQDWYYVSDFTPVETTMNFSYRAGYWTYIGFYNESQTALATVAVYNHGTQDSNDSNTGYGNITGSNLPAGTKYIRISGTSDDSNHMSLIRTA